MQRVYDPSVVYTAYATLMRYNVQPIGACTLKAWPRPSVRWHLTGAILAGGRLWLKTSLQSYKTSQLASYGYCVPIFVFFASPIVFRADRCDNAAREPLCFAAVSLFFFYSARDLRGLSADRRETLPHNRKWEQF